MKLFKWKFQKFQLNRTIRSQYLAVFHWFWNSLLSSMIAFKSKFSFVYTQQQTSILFMRALQCCNQDEPFLRIKTTENITRWTEARGDNLGLFFQGWIGTAWILKYAHTCLIVSQTQMTQGQNKLASDTEICFHETSRTANERQSVFDRNISKFRPTLGKVLNLNFQSLVVFC